LTGEFLPTLHDHIAIPRVEFDQPRLPVRRSQAISVVPIREWVEDDVASLGRVRIARSISSTGFMVDAGRSSPAGRWSRPRLVACAAPEMIAARLPTVENWFVLALVVRATEREAGPWPRR